MCVQMAIFMQWPFSIQNHPYETLKSGNYEFVVSHFRPHDVRHPDWTVKQRINNRKFRVRNLRHGYASLQTCRLEITAQYMGPNRDTSGRGAFCVSICTFVPVSHVNCVPGSIKAPNSVRSTPTSNSSTPDSLSPSKGFRSCRPPKHFLPALFFKTLCTTPSFSSGAILHVLYTSLLRLRCQYLYFCTSKASKTEHRPPLGFSNASPCMTSSYCSCAAARQYLYFVYQ
jgi:hypothetical protein